MNVSGVGGAASLPVPLSTGAHAPVPGTGTAGTTAAGSTGPAAAPGTAAPPGPVPADPGTAGAGGTNGALPAPGDLRLPGQHPAVKESVAHHKEVPKPAPLPPLKGLTVAEIRAMLGVAMLPAASEEARQAASGTVQSAVNRYA